MGTSAKGAIPGHLVPTQQPALVLSPAQYQRNYQDGLNNILRLYFSQIDNLSTNLLTNTGGSFLGFPHIAAADNTDQTTANNTATVVKWDTLDSNVGFTFNYPSTPPAPANPLEYSATANISGIYKIDYSLQFANTDNNTIHEAYVWLEIAAANSTTFIRKVGSASKFSVPGKHTGSDGYLVAYSSLTFTLEAGESVRLMWAVSKAYVVSPAADGIYMEAYPEHTIGTAPAPTATIPSIPSAVGTIAFISNTPA